MITDMEDKTRGTTSSKAPSISESIAININCTLCSNVLTSPKVLPCQHSFCADCIDTYITDHWTGEGEEGSGFHCPQCSEFCMLSNANNEKIEKWSDFLQSNCVVDGIISIIKSSDFSASSEEEVRGTPQWPCMETVLTAAWYEESQKIPLCTQHAKKLEYYCRTHGQVLCSDCYILTHRTCDSIAKCDDVISAYKEKATSLSESAEISTKVVESLIKDISEKFTDLQKDRDRAKSEIRKFKEEIIKRLEEEESIVTAEIDKAYEERAVVYNEMLKCCATILQGLESTNKIAHALQNITCPEFVVSTVIEKQQSHKSEKALLEEIMRTTRVCRLHVSKKLSLVDSMTHFCSLVTSDLKMKPSESTESLDARCNDIELSNEVSSSLKFEKELNTLLPGDAYNAWITGITFLKDDTLVVVDRNNAKVKVFALSGALVDSVSFPQVTLFGVTSTRENEVAVTMPIKQTVQFIELSAKGLEVSSRCISVKQPCFGITSELKQLFVCCAQLRSAPCCIKVFDEAGTFLRDIIFDFEGNSLFSMLHSANISINPITNTVSVVDQPLYRHSIVTFDLNGYLKSRDYMPYIRDKVCSIAYLDTQLLVAIGNRKLCLLSKQASGGNEVTEINTKTNIHCAHALAVSRTKDKIAVSQADPTFNYSVNNIVLIFMVDT